jgi:uncharacterized protein (DUF305 family)
MHRETSRAARRKWAAIPLVALSIAAIGAQRYQSPFLGECNEAMARMMLAMHIASRGNADDDFAAMMVPHHEGAIAMARAELRYGKNEQLRRLAQEIIVTQQQEIVAMHLAAPKAFSTDSSVRHTEP